MVSVLPDCSQQAKALVEMWLSFAPMASALQRSVGDMAIVGHARREALYNSVVIVKAGCFSFFLILFVEIE